MIFLFLLDRKKIFSGLRIDLERRVGLHQFRPGGVTIEMQVKISIISTVVPRDDQYPVLAELFPNGVQFRRGGFVGNTIFNAIISGLFGFQDKVIPAQIPAAASR